MEQLQGHIWLMDPHIWGNISSYIRNHFATAPLWIFLYMRKIVFYQCSCKVTYLKNWHFINVLEQWLKPFQFSPTADGNWTRSNWSRLSMSSRFKWKGSLAVMSEYNLIVRTRTVQMAAMGRKGDFSAEKITFFSYVQFLRILSWNVGIARPSKGIRLNNTIIQHSRTKESH
jgi:hypothetical protein